jgi:hypothetical protein
MSRDVFMNLLDSWWYTSNSALACQAGQQKNMDTSMSWYEFEAQGSSGAK